MENQWTKRWKILKHPGRSFCWQLFHGYFLVPYSKSACFDSPSLGQHQGAQWKLWKMTKIPSTWNDNTLICRNVACFVQLLHHTQITMLDHVGKWVGYVGFLKHAKLQYPQWRGHWKSTSHNLSCQFFTQNAAEPICQSKNCIQLMLPRGGPNGVDAPLQYPTAFWRRAWKRPRDLQIQKTWPYEMPWGSISKWS